MTFFMTSKRRTVAILSAPLSKSRLRPRTCHYSIHHFTNFHLSLPLDGSNGAPVIAEVDAKGKKKEIMVQCALKACQILDKYGVLRKSNQGNMLLHNNCFYTMRAKTIDNFIVHYFRGHEAEE